MNLSSLFDIGQTAMIDGDQSMAVTICAVNFRYGTAQTMYITYQCSWIHNGSAHNEWIEEWRLSDAV